MDPFLAQIILFAGNFAPRGWAFCEGQLLPIAQNQALFSILGTTYGGDGRTTFGLPDLRGRAPIHPGTGPGLSNHTLGQKSGQETVTLTTNQLPSHSHTAHMMASSGQGTTNTADGNALNHIPKGGTPPYFYNSDNPTIAMNANSVVVDNAGGGQAVNNMQPVLALNYIIAVQGTFPSRT
jgi:microcystin-dependent protein